MLVCIVRATSALGIDHVMLTDMQRSFSTISIHFFVAGGRRYRLLEGFWHHLFFSITYSVE